MNLTVSFHEVLNPKISSAIKDTVLLVDGPTPGMDKNS